MLIGAFKKIAKYWKQEMIAYIIGSNASKESLAISLNCLKIKKQLPT